jgi:type VI secretion system secreted protein VgrG
MSRIDFKGAGLPDDVVVVALRGAEGISELYELELFLVSSLAAASDLDLDGTLGKRGTMMIKASATATEQHRYHGIVREIEIVQAALGGALLRLVLVPELFKLTQSRHARVYTFQKIDAVIKDVLSRAGLSGSSTVTAKESHPDEEHVVQYRESDYRFLARWMEREGFVYWFKHGDDREQLLITDSSSDAEDLGPVRYHPTAGGDTSGGIALKSFRALSSAAPKSVIVNDYDHDKPSLDVTGEESAGGEGGVVVQHEARTISPGDAARLAKIRAQAIAAERLRCVGRGTVFGIRPGFVIELEEHPRAALNQKYLVTRVEHRASQAHQLLDHIDLDLPRGYEVVVYCVPADVPYRKLPTTPWPRIRGYQLGVVDGPADSDYAQLDDAGRYLVKFMFDESDLSGDQVSTRIRMMQPHAGAPEGWHFPLRKGTEVVVQFTGGDPDRPVIAGAVPNAKNPSVVVESNHTQNVLQTGGLTRLEIEDDDGKQYIWIKTPPANTHLNLGYTTLASHHITLHTDKDALFNIGSNQLIEVGGVLDEQVVSDVKETYHADQTSTITGPQKTTVDDAVKETYLSTQQTTVTGSPRQETFLNGQQTIVLGARQEGYTGSQVQQVVGTTDETWVGSWTRTSGATTETHLGDLTEIVAGPSMEMCPAGVTENYGDTTGLWASLLWIGSTIHYTVPNSTETKLISLEFGNDFKNIKPTVSKWEDALSLGANGLKLELVGISLGGTGLKMEANGTNYGINGGKFEPGGLDVTFSAVWIAAVGMKADT